MATATANGGQPDDLDINSSGAVEPPNNTAPAVTLNSSNVVTNEGTIQFNNVSNSTAVEIQGGNTGSFTNSGTINNIEDFDPPDNNQDGVVEAPLAQGTNRYGIHVTGSAPFVGSITNSSSLFVEGNGSFGLSIDAPVTGNIYNSGTIGVTGDNSFGIRTTAPVNGSIQITGPVSVSGQFSSAVSVNNDVSGSISVYSDLTGNGFSTSARSISDTNLRTIQSTASEQEQSGPPLIIGGNVAGGVFIGAPPVSTASGSTDDNDGDGVPDGSEGAGTVTSFGSAPAIVVGGTNRDVTLGAFGTGQNAFGLIVRGTVTSTGLYDTIPSTGVQIGGTGGAANLVGGFRLTGTVSSSAYEAAATGILLGAGANVPVLQNENSIAATISHSSLAPETSATATGVLIQPGAVLTSIINYGFIVSTASGSLASTTAVNDQSGSVTNVLNQGSVNTVLTPGVTGGTTSGKRIAFDLSHNTTGITFTQSTNPSPIALTGTTDANGVFTAATTTPTTPVIDGDVLLGNGNNTVNILGGSINGALSLGSGSDSLTIDNAAAYTGALTHTGSNLVVNVNNGTLTNTSSVPLQATSLTVGASGSLSIAVDPVNNRAGGFLVSGPATLANGAKVGINVISTLPINAQNYTLITSPQLTVGETATQLLGSVPYVAIASLNLNQAAGTLSVNLRQRTAAEAGFNQAETAAMQPIYGALSSDPALQAALFAPTDRASFIGIYDQMLPDYSGGVFRLASAASRSISRATSDADGPWLQEVTVAAELDSGHNAVPFKAVGLGIAGGLERASSIGAIGVTGSLFTGDIRVPKSPGDTRSSESQLEAGLTWRVDIGQLRIDARGAGGYVAFNNRRELVVKDDTGAETLDRLADGRSSGWSLAGHFGGSYRAQAGRFYLQPEAHVDYFRLSQGAYTETGGGAAYDLSVARRIGAETSAQASLRMGASFGRDFTWRPEIEVGYREIVSGGPGVTTANYAGGQTFSLDPAAIQKGGEFGRIGFAAGNELYDVSIAGGAEVHNGYTEGDLKFRLRLLF